jgi:malonyl-CoA O-methyltransferase
MIHSIKKMRQNFSRAAAEYDQQAQFQQQQMRRVLARAQQIIPAGARVLDIGCGTGLFAHEARDSQWDITGVDVAFEMCYVAMRRGAFTVNADASALPFMDGAFDAVVSSLCVQWATDKRAVFREMYRMIKPGGVAIIATLGSDTLRELRAEAAAANVSIGLLSMDMAENYQRFASDAGFELLAIADAAETHDYANARALLESMRSIGAQSAKTHQTRALAPRRMLQMLSNYDKNYATLNGVKATWQPILLHLRKPL